MRSALDAKLTRRWAARFVAALGCWSLLGCGELDVSDLSVTVQPRPDTAAATSALLSWTTPEQNTDGSPLADLAGYNVYYGAQARSAPGSARYDVVIDIGIPVSCARAEECGFRVDDLEPGTWYFAVTAYNASGRESSYSDEGVKVIP